MIQRFSSRKTRLGKSFLADRLDGARAYDRIAGYFSSSILEIAGEQIEAINGSVRIVCNSQLDERDVITASAAMAAMRQEWCATEPESFAPGAKERFVRLSRFLKEGKIQVRVLPDTAFGLVHGKAGVITKNDGTKTAFMGSANETVSGWLLNYELIWEDDSPEAVAWVQEEFDALWNHKDAYNLADFVISDIERLAKRTVIASVEDWKKEPDPGATIVESPVYRNRLGLWEHQKYFVNLAFNAHRTKFGARYILADEVGLGKTIQLAATATLIALTGTKPLLLLVPKTLIVQWQDEMRELLNVPSAYWNGKQWIDEQGIEYPVMGEEGIRHCPRRIGIMSQGLITRLFDDHNSILCRSLLEFSYDCVIVDEAHRARRKNIAKIESEERPEPNNLLAFLQQLAGRTKTLLLATATPVQMHPIEAYDLLTILGGGENENVIGARDSKWRHAPFQAIEMIRDPEHNPLPEEDLERWGWIRNPLPPAAEGPDFQVIRRELKLTDDDAWTKGFEIWDRLSPPAKDRVRRISRNFMQNHNPFIRFIVRRTRKYLEDTKNPETDESYLKEVKVKLYGEQHANALTLNVYLQDAFREAEDFCTALSLRASGTGFLKTLLLRRVGSTLYAGRTTAEKMLGMPSTESANEDDDDDQQDVATSPLFRDMTETERGHLIQFHRILSEHEHEDPKILKVKEILLEKGWLERGCIVFSQYFDSVEFLAKILSADMPDEIIGIYAGGNKSGTYQRGIFLRVPRETIKAMVKKRQIRLLIGTDAASEGLNLQSLGALINLDLPWNPTRLEQRKGRIQRIGQMYDDIWIFNLRYGGSVEDRVHDLLSDRLQSINTMFGQIPDVLEDVWVEVAQNKIDDAKQTINALPPRHPFELKYERPLGKIPWEECSTVLDKVEMQESLRKGW
ncbi:MAG: phospholipase D-like domain-containing protein [Methanoregula sp.]